MSAALVVRSLQAKRATQPTKPLERTPLAKPPAEMAFYRKYTEGMLRRYLYRSMEIGRVPSLLGNFSLRAKSSSRKGYTFEDSVIFVHDVERCLALLSAEQRELVSRIALQEYTLMETAEFTRMSVRTLVRRYEEALDRLTQVFLRLELMQIPGACSVSSPGGSERGR